MYNKFKVKKKVISIALALALATQPLATLPMNVFANTPPMNIFAYTPPMNVSAGTGKNGVMVAPLKADVKELNKGQKLKTEYIVSKSVAFSDENVLNGSEIQGPGIVYAKEKVDNSMRDVYIIADINGILNAAGEVVKSIAEELRFESSIYNESPDSPFAMTYGPYNVASSAAEVVATAFKAEPLNAAYGVVCTATWAVQTSADDDAGQTCFDVKSPLAKTILGAANAESYSAWVDSYRTNASGVVNAIVVAYKSAQDGKQVPKDWLNAAYAAVKVAEKMSDGNGLDLEAKLKIVYMAYRIAQFTLLYNTSVEDKQAKANACKERADALQEMIDKVYSDPVGDIEAQAAKATETTNDPEE